MKIYLVGGAVRDKLLHLPIADKDWVVIGATPQEMLEQGYCQVGNDFPVYLHPETKEEYALARTERKSHSGHTGFICDFNPKITLEEDLLRRDLTINAIAETLDGEIIDPFQGVADLKQRQLRHVSPAFREDPLRILRVARFAARFHSLGFNIAADTMHLMQEMVSNGEINHLTVERVWQETENALRCTDPEVYFYVLQETGALQVLFPEIASLFKSCTNALPLRSLKICAALTQNIPSRFATVFSDLYDTREDSPRTAIKSRALINEFCRRLKTPSRYRKTALLVHDYYAHVLHIVSLSAKEILEIFDGIDVWRHPIQLEHLLVCTEAIFKSKPNQYKSDFPQAQIAQKLYRAALQVTAKQPIAEGYVGAEIKEALKSKRILAIEHAQSALFNK